MKLVALGEVTLRVRSWNPARTAPDKILTYIDLSAVDNQTKTIGTVQEIAGAEAPSRARQLVAIGDILVSTVRPNLNGVARVSSDLDGATASTGFCVLRVDPTKLDRNYLYHWVTGAQFVDDMIRKATGASYPAVSDRIIGESQIPLPPLPEQRRIAGILDQADALRRLRRQSLSRLSALGQAIFEERFGDLVANERQFAPGLISEIVKGFDTGKNLAPDPDNADAKNRVLKVSAVTSGTFRDDETKPLPDSYQPPASHFIRKGDLLFSRANTVALIGATAIVQDDVSNLVLPDKIWRFQWHNASEAIFTHFLFQSRAMRREISSRASGTSGSMKNIGKEKVLTIRLGIPRYEERQRFEAIMRDVQTLLGPVNEAVRQADSLFASLQHRAFRGEL